MSKVVEIQLEWKYTPKNYIEEPISIEFEGGTLEINDGVVLAVIDPELFHENQYLGEELTAKVESRLHAVQILTHKDFEISKPSRIDMREDGTKGYYLEVEPCVMTMSAGTVDLVIKDRDGNVVSDTKRERLDKQSDLADLFDKHRANDALLDQMIKSYRQSVKDPDNELIHLYEIRDALTKRFGSKNKAVAALGITNGDWDKIGKLANASPVKQGRHRGQALGVLRDAEPKELEIARNSVTYLIEKYLEFLEA